MKNQKTSNIDKQLEQILAALKAQGFRLTPSRKAIVAQLLANEHLNAEELFTFAKKQDPSIHIATVYRTLEVLERLGLIEHIHLGHGRASYQIVSDLHKHLVCTKCSKIVEIPNESLKSFVTKIKRDYGFYLKIGHFALPGLCKDCAREP